MQDRGLPFDLKQYVPIPDLGREYVRIWGELLGSALTAYDHCKTWRLAAPGPYIEARQRWDSAAALRSTSLAKKNFPSLGTIMICTLSDSFSAIIF